MISNFFRRLIIVVAIFLISSGCRFAANRQNSLGYQSYQSGQIAQAINNFQRALNLDPNNADAYYNLGSSYYQLGKQSNISAMGRAG